MALRRDDIGFGGYTLLQDDSAFCYGVDAVLLADLARCGPADRVMDLGTGNGIVPLIIHARYTPASITGLEVQNSVFELALANVSHNELSDRIKIVKSDVLDVRRLFPAESFTVVTCNPPYTEKGRGIPGSNPVQFTARHETTAAFSDFAAAASWLLPKGGRFCVVHRPSRLADIFESCRACGMEPKALRMVVPHAGEEANIVLVEAVKGAGKELKVLPELVVRSADGSYTDEIEKIYCRK